MRRSREREGLRGPSAAEEVAKTLVSSRSPSPPGSVPTRSCSARSPRPTSPPRSTSRRASSIDRKQIHLDEPIKAIGTHLVPVKLHANVEFPVTVEVVAEA
jgi:hypothetical protein